MTNVWTLAALWFGLALFASLCSIYLRVSTALAEIIVGTGAGWMLATFVGAGTLGADEPWIKFLAGAGAIMLTFLAGAELDPVVFRQKWKEATAVGVASFLLPFLGCAAAAYYLLGWDVRASWLAGIAMSTTSVAVVYAVMLEYGFNKTVYGKTILAACFITDLGTVLALGFIFAPFDYKTFIFAGVAIAVFAIMPWLTPRLFKRHGDKPSELEAKYLLLDPVRARRARDLGRQRSGAAGLCARHVARGLGRPRPCADPAAAHAHPRPDDPVLFHPRRLVSSRFPTSSPRRPPSCSCWSPRSPPNASASIR